MFLAPDAVTAITKLTIVRTSTHQLRGWRYRSGRSPAQEGSRRGRIRGVSESHNSA